MVLRLRVPAPGGWKKAKCLSQVRRDDTGEIYDPFFAETDAEQQEAIDFCNGAIDGNVCPIRAECLIFAATNNERQGVWGGMSEADRKILRKVWPWKGGKKPRPEWRWMRHEEVQMLLPEEERARLLMEVDDEED